MNRPVFVILAAVLLYALCGCEEDELAKAAREAAKQSADQQRQLAQMQAEVARGAGQLVEADAKARAELAALQRDLQQDQADIGRQRDQLETDRRQIAEQRHRDPLIAAAITSIGLILACLLPLLLCWALLRRPPLDGEAEAALAEFLVQDLISDHPVLLPAHAPPALLEQPSPNADDSQDSPEERQPVPG
jgi:hypothetical protein